MVCESDRTREIGREFELPKTYCELIITLSEQNGEFLTPIATTKLRGLFEKPKAIETRAETRKETKVWTMKMTGMMASSISLSVVN